MKLIINNKIYDIEMYISPFKKLKGFMFSKRIDKIICFPRCRSIHTFFMRRPIGVIYLDKGLNVMKIINSLNKNRISYCKNAYYVIECNTELLKNNSSIKITRN